MRKKQIRSAIFASIIATLVIQIASGLLSRSPRTFDMYVDNNSTFIVAKSKNWFSTRLQPTARLDDVQRDTSDLERHDSALDVGRFVIRYGLFSQLEIQGFPFRSFESVLVFDRIGNSYSLLDGIGLSDMGSSRIYTPWVLAFKPLYAGIIGNFLINLVVCFVVVYFVKRIRRRGSDTCSVCSYPLVRVAGACPECGNRSA